MISVWPVMSVRRSVTAIASLAAMRVRFSSSTTAGTFLPSITCTRPHSPASGFTIQGTSSTVAWARTATPDCVAPALSVHWISTKYPLSSMPGIRAGAVGVARSAVRPLSGENAVVLRTRPNTTSGDGGGVGGSTDGRTMTGDATAAGVAFGDGAAGDGAALGCACRMRASTANGIIRASRAGNYRTERLSDDFLDDRTRALQRHALHVEGQTAHAAELLAAAGAAGTAVDQKGQHRAGAGRGLGDLRAAEEHAPV